MRARATPADGWEVDLLLWTDTDAAESGLAPATTRTDHFAVVPQPGRSRHRGMRG